jgi:hypothetical protein
MKVETLQQPSNNLSPELIFAIAELIRALHLAGKSFDSCFLFSFVVFVCFVRLQHRNDIRQTKEKPTNKSSS